MNWQQFLDGVFLGDQEAVDFVQRLMGYAASGDKTLRLIPVFYSLRPSGKTTFFRALHYVMGPELVFGGFVVFDLSRSADLPSPDHLQLRKATVLVFSSILRSRKPGLPTRLKLLAADEMVRARGVCCFEPDVFRNASTPFLEVNEIPEDFFQSSTLASQGVFVEFPATFSPGDPSVLSALKNDQDAVKRWLAEGMARWHSEGLRIPERFGLPPKRRVA